jgi:ketosteroid isomerase-like protein
MKESSMTLGSTTNANNAKTLLEKFARAFAEDNPGLLLSLLASDCEWTIMPTGERFKGLLEIRSLTEKVQSARAHSDEAKLTIREAFSDAAHLCIEFLHRGVVTNGFGGGGIDAPPPGAIFEIDFCVTARIRDGKIIRVREYFDHSQFTTPPERRPKFFS